MAEIRVVMSVLGRTFERGRHVRFTPLSGHPERSALGQKQTLEQASEMSALPTKADISAPVRWEDL